MAEKYFHLEDFVMKTKLKHMMVKMGKIEHILDGLKSRPSLEGEVREHTKRIKPVRRHSQQLKPITTQYSVNKMIMMRKRKQCMR